MKRDDIRESFEDTYSKICTFSPQTNNKELVFNENSKSVYKRLFDDYARRKYNSQLNLKKLESESENLANKKHLKNLDKKRIEKLYQDHKKNKIHKNTMQKQFDEVAGLTFKPSIPNVEKYGVSNDFYQRNEILLHKKNIFSDWYQKILKENFDNKHKNYTAEQVEEIKNNIVDRLYKKDLEKIKEKKNLYENVDKDKFDYKKDLRNNNYINSEFYQNYPSKNNSKLKDKILNHNQTTTRSKSKNSTRNMLNIHINNSLKNVDANKTNSRDNIQNNNNFNNLAMRFSFKNDNLKLLENNLNNINDDENITNMENSEIDSNYNTIKYFNNNLNNLSGNNNDIESKNINFNSKTDDYKSNNEESVITEIDNQNVDRNSARRISYQNDADYEFNENTENLIIKNKNFTNENLSNDKKFNTIDNTNSSNGNNKINNTYQNRKIKDSEALLKHFVSNKNNINAYKDHNTNGKHVINSERMIKNLNNNSISNDQNNNLLLNHISLASPLNLLSTKSTNNHAGNSSIKKANASYSNMDYYNGENINSDLDTIHQENYNFLN